jgi:hypothetical protein
MMNEAGFYWQRHAVAERLVLDVLDDFARRNRALARLQQCMMEQASCRLVDWVDCLHLPGAPKLRQRLAGLGFVPQSATDREAYYHPGALLPTVLLAAEGAGGQGGVALRVDCVAEFLQANRLSAAIEGSPLSSLRSAVVNVEGGVQLSVLERRGSLDYEPATQPPACLVNYLTACELWQTRRRHDDDEDRLWTETFRLTELLVERLGVDLAACVVCSGERQYWQVRNAAGRLQKSRQDFLGLGWGNHDHHTFRSSRRHFARLVTLFGRLGFEARERFYAGEQAGWGAQVMENRGAGLSLFLDVDLAPQEVATDFTVEALPERDSLGTVGLWCALHGDSIFGAGMHHLAARCDFERLIADLARLDVTYMAPFSDFPWLKQAFSTAERWPVDAKRVARLLADGMLTVQQGEKFLAEGAVGSHLENIQRGHGYKGFNKDNVSAIIRKTDPRI